MLTGLYGVLTWIDRASDVERSKLDELDYQKQMEQKKLEDDMAKYYAK